MSFNREEKMLLNDRTTEGAAIKKSNRYVLSAGLAVCLAGALSLGSAAVASAAPVSGSHRGGGGSPGWSTEWGSRFGHGRGALLGTVVTAPGTTEPTTFTMDVTSPGSSTTTLVTVGVSTTATINEPGTSSPSLSAVVSGDQVEISGTQDGTNMVNATSVRLVPANTVLSTTTTALTATAMPVFPPRRGDKLMWARPAGGPKGSWPPRGALRSGDNFATGVKCRQRKKTIRET